jgi:acyl carrier protein
MDLLGKIKRIISEQTGTDEEKLSESTTIEDIVSDSLDIVEMLMNIEEEFDIDIPDSDVKNLTTVGEFCSYIEERLQS